MSGLALLLVGGATVLVLGFNWPIMAVGVDHVAPLWLAACRVAGAGLVVAGVTAATAGLRLPASGDRSIVLSVGLGHLAFVSGAVFLALRFVPPGRSAILTYTSSLWAVPLAITFLNERLTRLRMAGLVAGLAGLALLMEPWTLDWSRRGLRLGMALLLLSAVGNAAITVHVRGHRWVGAPLHVMPFQFAVALPPLVVAALLVDGPPPVRWDAEAIAVIAYQILLGSAFGLWGHLTMARNLPSITVNLALMAVPVIGLASSIVLLDEPLTAAVTVALLLVVSGVGLGLVSDRRAPVQLPS